MLVEHSSLPQYPYFFEKIYPIIIKKTHRINFLNWQKIATLHALQLIIENIALRKPAINKFLFSGCNGSGKTFLTANLILWQMLAVKLINPKSRINGVVIALTMGQLKQGAILNFKNAVENFKNKIFSVDNEKVTINIGNKGYLYFRVGNVSNTQTLQGVHGDDVIVFIDEAGNQDQYVFDKTNTFAANLKDSRTTLYYTGNPYENSGMFFNYLKTEKVINKIQNINRGDLWDNVTLENDLYALDIAHNYGIQSDMYRTSVLGKPPLVQNERLVSDYVLDKCMNRTYVRPHGEYIIGFDVASKSGPAFSSYICKFKGKEGHGIKEIFFNNLEVDDYAELAISVIYQYRPVSIGIDNVGIGIGFYERLYKEFKNNSWGMKIYGASRKIVTSSPLKYANKRTELGHVALDWLKHYAYLDKDLKNMDILINQLASIKYEKNTSDGIKLEEKWKSGVSQDAADALFYSFLGHEVETFLLNNSSKVDSRYAFN